MNELVAVQCESRTDFDRFFSSANHACQDPLNEYISVVVCGNLVRRFRITNGKIEKVGNDIPIVGGDYYEGVAAAFPDNETLIFARDYNMGLFKYEIQSTTKKEEFVLKDQVLIPIGKPLLAIDSDKSVYSMIDASPPVVLHFHFNNTDFTNSTTLEGAIQAGNTHIAVSNNGTILAFNMDTGQLQFLNVMPSAEPYNQDDLTTCPGSIVSSVVAGLTSTVIIVVGVIVPATAAVIYIVKRFYWKPSMDNDQQDSDGPKRRSRHFAKGEGGDQNPLEENGDGSGQQQGVGLRQTGIADQLVRQKASLSEEERVGVMAGGDPVQSQVTINVDENTGAAGTVSSTDNQQAVEPSSVDEEPKTYIQQIAGFFTSYW